MKGGFGFVASLPGLYGGLGRKGLAAGGRRSLRLPLSEARAEGSLGWRGLKGACQWGGKEPGTRGGPRAGRPPAGGL